MASGFMRRRRFPGAPNMDLGPPIGQREPFCDHSQPTTWWRRLDMMDPIWVCGFCHPFPRTLADAVEIVEKQW